MIILKRSRHAENRPYVSTSGAFSFSNITLFPIPLTCFCVIIVFL